MEENVYSDFGLDFYAQKEMHKSLSLLLENLDFSTVSDKVKDIIQQLQQKGEISINIPETLQKKLKEFTQDKKVVSINEDSIQILNDKKELVANVPFKMNISKSTISKLIPYIGFVIVMYEISAALESLNEKVNDVLKGQMDDREAKCIAAIETYYILKDQTPKWQRASLIRNTFPLIEEGLIQIHMQIERLYQKICLMPTSDWKLFIQTITNFSHDSAGEQGHIITEFVYALIRYKRFIEYSKVILEYNSVGSEWTSSLIYRKYEHLTQRVLANQTVQKVFDYFREQLPNIPKLFKQEMENSNA